MFLSKRAQPHDPLWILILFEAVSHLRQADETFCDTKYKRNTSQDPQPTFWVNGANGAGFQPGGGIDYILVAIPRSIFAIATRDLSLPATNLFDIVANDEPDDSDSQSSHSDSDKENKAAADGDDDGDDDMIDLMQIEETELVDAHHRLSAGGVIDLTAVLKTDLLKVFMVKSCCTVEELRVSLVRFAAYSDGGTSLLARLKPSACTPRAHHPRRRGTQNARSAHMATRCCTACARTRPTSCPCPHPPPRRHRRERVALHLRAVRAPRTSAARHTKCRNERGLVAHRRSEVVEALVFVVRACMAPRHLLRAGGKFKGSVGPHAERARTLFLMRTLWTTGEGGGTCRVLEEEEGERTPSAQYAPQQRAQRRERSDPRQTWQGGGGGVVDNNTAELGARPSSLREEEEEEPDSERAAAQNCHCGGLKEGELPYRERPIVDRAHPEGVDSDNGSRLAEFEIDDRG
ncbi:hypothetical protein B0H10DRAFT_2296915 [Mycena sp. CBHHK59/15]|nr:hypothetical protein B0H10DRAFT_2296915 [Mycena sp. CBHHK59/15]